MSALLTEAEVADLLRIPAGTLKKWRTRGDGPPFTRVGRLVRYREQELDAWLTKRTSAGRAS